MEPVLLSLLVAVLVIQLVQVGLGVILWWRHVSLASRVTRLEVQREHAITQAEFRQVYERLSSIEGQIKTTNQLMQTVQEHLLEND